MGVIIKQSFWATVISYAGVLIGYFNTLYLRPLYFEMDQIGLFQLITANGMMLSPIATLGLGSSYIRFFPKYEEKARNQLFSLFLLFTFIGVSIVIIGGIVCKDLIYTYYENEAPEYLKYLGVTALVIAINSFFELFYSYTRSVLNVILPSALREIFLRLGMIALIVGYAVEWLTFDQAVVGIGVIYVASFSILLFACIVFHHLKFDFRNKLIEKKGLRSIYAYSLYAMLLAGSFAIINNSSYNQITSILGSSATGVFTVCFFIGVVVEMPRRNMAKIIQPIISSASENGNRTEIKKIYQKSSITMSAIGALLFIGIGTNILDLFQFIPKGQEFQHGFWVVIAVCCAKLGLMTTGFPGEIMSFSPYYRFNLYFQIIAAVLLVFLNEWLIPDLGLNGVAISYLITILFLSYARVAFVFYKFKIHPFQSNHFKLFLILMIVGILAYYFQLGTHPILMIALRSVLTTILYVFLIYKFNISEDINRLIHSTFDKINKRPIK